MKALFHFLGGVHFAVLLIATTVLFVIGGTFLEAYADSHLFAAAYTYKSPLFQGLLWLFFVNILFAALRRWPFKKKHIPFLLTHLGLLMILGGVLAKQLFGLQGVMLLTEGCAKNHVFLPNTYALTIEDRHIKEVIPVQKKHLGPLHSSFENLSIEVLNFEPHAEVTLERWICDQEVFVEGLPPFKAYTYNHEKAPLPPSLKVDIEGELWSFYAALSDVPICKEKLHPPYLLFTKTSTCEESLFACNSEGVTYKHTYAPKELTPLYLIDKGFGGYELALTLPATLFKTKRTVTLTTPLKRRAHPQAPLKKREAMTPLLTLKLSDNHLHEVISVPLSQGTTPLKWPALGGRFLLSFQWEEKKLPYTVKLREGRKRDYPNTSRPFSYESDLLFSFPTGETLAKTISMNHVFQAPDGCRYYMANLQRPKKGGAARVQLAVNKDPAKRFLTYPGGVILGCGMVLLFTFRRRQ